MGRKVKNQNFKKFIDQKEIIKGIKFLIDIKPPAIPEDIFIKSSTTYTDLISNIIPLVSLIYLYNSN